MNMTISVSSTSIRGVTLIWARDALPPAEKALVIAPLQARACLQDQTPWEREEFQQGLKPQLSIWIVNAALKRRSFTVPPTPQVKPENRLESKFAPSRGPACLVAPHLGIMVLYLIVPDIWKGSEG